MSRRLGLWFLALGGVALCLLIWSQAGGLLAPIGDWAAQEQREFQNSMAGALRALRAGQPGALAVLLSVCFAYGFFHAIGPGHGKVLIGGYGLGRAVPWRRLSLLALLSSLGQAVTAVLLVYGAISLLQLGRDSMIGIAEKTMAPISYAAIAGIGIWLLVRGARKLLRTAAAEAGAADGDPEPRSHASHSHAVHSHHHHPQDHPGKDESTTAEVCADCGHRHAPSLEEVSSLSNWREAFVLILGIAIRPCTGALFVLIITWQMGIALAGIAGAFAMALGTASVTITVGLAAIGLRGSALSLLAGSNRARQVVPMLEICAGVLVALFATGLLLRSL